MGVERRPARVPAARSRRLLHTSLLSSQRHLVHQQAAAVGGPGENERLGARRPAPAPRAHDFSKMTVVQLREHLRRAGKSTTGGRDELERRARGFPDLPPKPARPSPANANAAQRAIFDRVSAKVTAAFDEFERLGDAAVDLGAR